MVKCKMHSTSTWLKAQNILEIDRNLGEREKPRQMNAVLEKVCWLICHA